MEATMKNSALLDSSYVISRLWHDDPHADRASEIADQLTKQRAGMYLSEYVVVESLTVLRLRASEDAVTTALQIFESSWMTRLHHERHLDSSVLRVFQDDALTSLSYVDIHLILCMEYHGIDTFVTFDQALATAARERGLQVLS
jgi:predicted nucleic acid-binding protein